eukprot:gene5178-8784_t
MDVQNTISFTTYLLYIIVLVVIFFVWKLVCPAAPQVEESDSESDEDKVEEREYTIEELKKFDGKNNDQKKVYISARGKVYDVTKSGFYGPGGPYSMFAGHDASICLAKNSFDTKLLNNFDLSELSFMERDSLEGFASNFEFKYICLGWLKEYREANPDEEKEEQEEQLFNDDELEEQPDDVLDENEKKNQ